MTQTQSSENDLIKSFSEIGQDQIFRFWKDLNQAQKQNLYKQLQVIEDSLLNEREIATSEVYQTLIQNAANADNAHEVNNIPRLGTVA